MKYVLFVDDDESSIENAVGLLKKDNWVANIIDDYSKVKSKIHDNKFDAIVCDLRLDDTRETGLDWAKKTYELFRDSGQEPRPILLSISSGERIKDAIAAGFDVALRKPLEPHTLQDILERT